ncbi:MAG: glycosyltransferase, partial [Pseudomonadota bacterium]
MTEKRGNNRVAPEPSDAGDPLTTIAFAHPPEPGLISVIVPCGPDFALLETTLRSIRNGETVGIAFEILVANDGGHEGVARLCRAYEAREIRIVPNAGPANARNAAMAQARGDVLAFTDADAAPAADWLTIARDAIKGADYVAGDVR